MKTMHFDISELLILYDIISFSFSEQKDDLMGEMVEKSTRLLGAQRLAIIENEDKQQKSLKYWGLQETQEIWNGLEKRKENSFLYPLAKGKLGLLYIEQDGPLSPRDKRLYTIFAQRVEEILSLINTEKKLKRSEREKAVILDGISELIVFQDKRNRILWVNRAAAESVKQKPEQLVGRACYEVWQQRSEPCENCPVIRALKTGQPQEGTMSSYDGRFWYIRSYPIKGENGDIEGVVEVITDVTKRIEAEEALQASQKTLQMVFNNVNDAIFIHEADGTIIDVNDKVLEMYNVSSKEEAVKLSILDDYSSPDNPLDQLPHLWKKVMAGESQLFEWKAKRPKDGTFFDVEVFLNKLDLGKRKAILATVRDITARKQEEKLLRNLFVYSPIGMYVVRHGKFLLVNSQFERYTGYTQEELLGTDALSLIVPEERNMVKRNAVMMLKGKRSLPYEFKIVNKNGETRWVVETVTSIRYQGERATLGSIMDATERKKMEEQLKYLSFHDKLTGLYNRAYFEEELKRLDIARQLPLSIIMGDVNGLKLVNDVFGHHKGDKLLINIAKVLRNNCRREDILCRWGGDEFAILLPKTDRKFAEKICVRIRNACCEAEKEPIPLSISLGTATKEEVDQDVWKVIKKAEDRMYRRKFLESKSTRSSVINFLQESLSEKTNETEKHVQRLKEYSLEMGRVLELPINELDKLVLLSSLHDIGKIAIPNNILEKPGKLTPEEWKTMKKHCEIGYRIVQSIPELAHIAEEILSHHERWDGTGYPRGLKGEEIPLLARILAIVDAYDVMINGRNYKKAVSQQEAIKELRRCAGSQFDPKLVEIFISLLK